MTVHPAPDSLGSRRTNAIRPGLRVLLLRQWRNAAIPTRPNCHDRDIDCVPFQFAMLQRKLDAIVAESSADSALDPNSDARARFQPSHDTRPRQFSDLQARANRASFDLPRQKGNLR